MSSRRDATGSAGTVLVKGRDVVVHRGAKVVATTASTGRGGEIKVEASRSVSIEGGGGLAATTSSTGIGGSIAVIGAGLVRIAGKATDGTPSSISTASTSLADDAGDAGSVFVSANDLTLENSGRIATDAGTADGGNIKLTVDHMVLLKDSQVTTSVRSGVGGGGNIDIDPEAVILIRSLIQANAFGGPGGNITIVTDNFFKDEFSRIEASSEENVSGTIEIVAPDQNIGEQLAVVPESFLDISKLLGVQCGARGGRVEGTFVGEGRGGVGMSPDGPLPSFYAAGSSATPTSTAGLQLAIADGGVKVVDSDEIDALEPIAAKHGFVPATLKLECVV